MSSGESIFCGGVVLVAMLSLPSLASAHVGKNAPVATNFQAQISGVRPATQSVEAKVVDGDRGLWLRVAPGAVVLIPGAEGEPLLRFEARGVFVNLRSLTAQSDRIDRIDLRPDPDPHAVPRWHRLSSGHAYLWHEHRLHALEPLARTHHRVSALGSWSVPLLIDGRRYELLGRLLYRPPGSLWPWLALAGLLSAIQVAALAASPSAGRRAAVTAAFAAAPLVWTVRIARELYGRPDIAWSAELEIAFTSLIGIAFLAGLLHRDESVRVFTAFLLAFGCLYEAWTMWPVLTQAVALTVLPGAVARTAIAAIIGLGAGMLVVTLREQFSAQSEEAL